MTKDAYTVQKIAVDEPEPGETGTIYEYQVKIGRRVMFTTYSEADANDAAHAFNRLPDLLKAANGMVYKACQRQPKLACDKCYPAIVAIAKAEGQEVR